jgi:hypothetical protein
MKKSLLIVIACLTLCIAANGQVNFGVKGGLNLFRLNTDSDDNFDTKSGVHVGLLGHIHITEQFALQPEIYYSDQGAKTVSDGETRKLNLGYVNMPLMFQYMFDNGFRLQAGPQLAVLASAKSKANGNSTDVKRSFNSFDVGVPVGVGYISPTGLGIDVRYQIGVSNVREDDDNKAYNRGLQIGLFYQFQHD